ncbi:MAG TPA: hypothetical protein VGD67_10320 [Pseudonocardiaceae bacterium]
MRAEPEELSPLSPKPPRGRTPSTPPRRRPKVAGHTTRRPGPDQHPEERSADTLTPADATAPPTTGPTPSPAEVPAETDAPPALSTPDATPATDAPDVTSAGDAVEPAAPQDVPVVPEATPTELPSSAAAPATEAERPVPRARATAPDGATARRNRPGLRPARREEPAPTSTAVTRGRARLAGVPLVVMLVLVAVLAAAGAAFFRGQAARAGTGATDNLAVVDNAATSEVIGQVSKAIEVVLSYDHTRLDENEAAGREVITGRYAEEFATTFADVRETAPEQKLVLTTTVLLAGVTSLTAGRAEVIATMDLAAVRDTTPYNSPGRVKVVATKVDGRWRISEMTLL